MSLKITKSSYLASSQYLYVSVDPLHIGQLGKGVEMPYIQRHFIERRDIEELKFEDSRQHLDLY